MDSKDLQLKDNKVQASVPMTSKACGGAAVAFGLLALFLAILGE